MRSPRLMRIPSGAHKAVATGRLHIFWVLDTPPLPLPDGWTSRHSIADDEEALVLSSRIEPPNYEYRHPNFVSQVRYKTVGVPAREHLLVTRNFAYDEMPRVTTDSGKRVPGWASWTRAGAEGSPLWSRILAGLIPPQIRSLFRHKITEQLATAAHFTIATSADPSEEEVSEALEACLELLRITNTALHSAAGGPLETPSPEAASLGTLIYLESVSRSGRPKTIWPLGLYALKSHLSLRTRHSQFRSTAHTGTRRVENGAELSCIARSGFTQASHSCP